MKLLDENSTVMEKTRELCAAIAGDDEFKGLLGKVEKFLGDDEARLGYQAVHQRGQELQQKQHSGLQISDGEISEFETAREELFQNNIASEFMAAQQDLEGLQLTINRYLGMTMETGRVPTAEEISAASSGCCGGASGGG